jgi:hypothetical protein
VGLTFRRDSGHQEVLLYGQGGNGSNGQQRQLQQDEGEGDEDGMQVRVAVG